MVFDNLFCTADSKLFAKTLVEKVATDLLKKDWSSMSTAEIDSLTIKIGKALKETFPDPKVHKTKQLGPKGQQKKYYEGLALV